MKCIHLCCIFQDWKELLRALSLGIRSVPTHMANSVEEFKGALQLVSEPQQGVRVLLRIPVQSGPSIH